MPSTTKTVLDHIILLLPDGPFDTPPAWLASNFTITAGGTHTSSPSRNKLIVFADGTYLELFNWTTDPSAVPASALPAMNKVWLPKEPGLIDFSLSSTGAGGGDDDASSSPASCISAANARLASSNSLGISYGGPIPGGRALPSGASVAWELSRPEYAPASSSPALATLEHVEEALFPNGRLDVPFWCHDVTARELRVPAASSNPLATTHACGATGVARVEVLVPPPLLEAYAGAYAAIVGDGEKKKSALEDGKEGWKVEIGTPASSGDGDKNGGGVVEVWIRSPADAQEAEILRRRGVGIAKIALRGGKKGRAGGEVPLGEDEFGRVVLF